MTVSHAGRCQGSHQVSAGSARLQTPDGHGRRAGAGSELGVPPTALRRKGGHPHIRTPRYTFTTAEGGSPSVRPGTRTRPLRPREPYHRQEGNPATRGSARSPENTVGEAVPHKRHTLCDSTYRKSQNRQVPGEGQRREGQRAGGAAAGRLPTVPLRADPVFWS